MNSSMKLMNIGSRQLQVFLEVYRRQSFAKAAESIPMSPSGVSMLIKELEEQVGARLFDRTTRSVAPTEAARRLRPVAERIVGELRQLDMAIGGMASAVRQRLDVAATPMVSSSLLPGVMRDFALSHPHVRVQLSDVEVGQVRRKVLEGESDIGLGFFEKPSAGLLHQPLCRFRLMCISPPARGARGLQPGRPWSSLQALPLITLPLDNPIQALIEKHMDPPRQERPRMNLIGTLMGMVHAGHGHAVVPSFALQECLRQGLAVSMLTEPAVHLDLSLISRRGGQAKSVVADFAEALKRAAMVLEA